MPDINIKWKDENLPSYLLNAENLHEIHPSLNALSSPFLVATDKRELTIKAETAIKIVNAGTHKVFDFGQYDVAFAVNDSILDTGTMAAGKDYYVYLVDKGDGTASVLLSLASTYPSGYNADNSRKVGGFHTLCASVGVISGHELSGYSAGDVLPDSVWCLNHRPECNPEGMVWCYRAQLWVDIYLSNTSYESTFGGTIKDGTNWMDFVTGLSGKGKKLLDDAEFQIVAAGSNEETNIAGSADPGITGGHTDTAGRRMISHVGCEDCCGVEWQWLRTPAARLDDGTVVAWQDLPGDKGSFYTYGTNGYGNTQLLAGGYWHIGTYCGSRSRFAYHSRWYTYSNIGGRGRARSQGAR